MDTYYKVLTIAGSDCSGGAGIQADLKTFASLGIYGMSVITAVTAQNTTGVRGIMAVTPEMVGQQIDAVFDDIRPDAVKIGMLANREIIKVVADSLRSHRASNIVLDPVMVSTSGSKLLEDDGCQTLVKELFPLATVVTPNRHEAEMLVGRRIKTAQDIDEALERIADLGANAVVIKSGHFDDKAMADYLYIKSDPDNIKGIKGLYTATRNTHGTGCTYSSAIAALLAIGYDLAEAVERAKKYITQAIYYGSKFEIGHGHGPVCHSFNPTTSLIRKK